jgi:hypothetical protein
MIRSNHIELEAERLAQSRKIVEVPPPQQPIPWRRGRPRKIKEAKEA